MLYLWSNSIHLTTSSLVCFLFKNSNVLFEVDSTPIDTLFTPHLLNNLILSSVKESGLHSIVNSSSILKLLDIYINNLSRLE